MSTPPTPAPSSFGRGTGALYARTTDLRHRVLIVAVGGAIVLAELILAVAVARPGAEVLLYPFVGAVGLALAFAFPFATICAFLILIATLLDSTYFSASFGVTATAPELVLGALLVVAVVRPRRRTIGGLPGVAILVYLALIVLASFFAVSAGRVDAATSRDFTIPFVYLFFYFVVVRLVPEPARMRRLLNVAVALAAITGAVALFVALFGDIGGLLQNSAGDAVSSQGAPGGLLRVRLPGVALAYGLLWYAVLELIRAERRLWWGLAVAGMGFNIVVSLNRNMWIGLLFGLAVLLVIGGPLNRRRLLGGIIALAIGVVFLVLVGPARVGPASAVEPLLKRGETLLAPGQELQDQSLRDRGTETVEAWRSLQGHFAFGLGVGAPFGIVLRDNLGGGRYQVSNQTFIHNQYLYVLVAGGVGALAAWLVFLGATLRGAWLARAREPAMLATVVALAMILLSAFVMLTFVDYAFMSLLALSAGAVFVLGGRSPGPARPSG